ncbi:MAG: alpha/beta hydrolase [Bacteroidota bacterium]
MRKTIVKFLSSLFPGAMVKVAYNFMTNPQVRKLRHHELAILDQAEKKRLPFEGFDIQTYRWGQGPKKILLIHGWEGQAGNFADLINPLLQKEYTVYAFDGPSHGFSSKGPTNLFEFMDVVGQLIQKFEVNKLISHSFGGVATTYALYANPKLKIDRYALLTTPDKFSERIDDVARQVGISSKVKNQLIKRIEQEIELDVSQLNVSRFVQDISVDSALIIHDKNDRVIPIQQSRNVWKNWEACNFEEIEGTGHFRILRTPAVLDKVVAFMN